MEHIGKGVELSAEDDPLDIIFGIGFRIGFMFVVVAIILNLIPFIDQSLYLTMDYVGFLRNFGALTFEVRMLVGAVMMVGVGIIMFHMKKLVEDFVNLLFWKDRS